MWWIKLGESVIKCRMCNTVFTSLFMHNHSCPKCRSSTFNLYLVGECIFQHNNNYSPTVFQHILDIIIQEVGTNINDIENELITRRGFRKLHYIVGRLRQ